MDAKGRSSKSDLSHVLRSAKVLQQQLKLGASTVKLSITGGGSGFHPDTGPIVVACVFDITSPTRDDANAHLNDLAEQGCECSGPSQSGNGEWTVSCNCTD